jgi:CBS domain containing-hemolysin-like protein
MSAGIDRHGMTGALTHTTKIIRMVTHHSITNRRPTVHGRRAAMAIAAFAAALAIPSEARASLLSEEAEDTLATILAIFVLFVVPVVLIALFWMVHVLPEKIAHKRHHPQFEAIRTLCLLSLAFGGLLWPLAWLWAYSKPVMYKMAYGTDKHPDALTDAESAPGDDGGTADLRERLVRLERLRVPASELTTLRTDLEAVEARFAQHETR